MSAHRCTEFTEGCFRCDLSRNESEVRGKPTTEQVREAYAAHGAWKASPTRGAQASNEQFDRWLAEVQAKAWERGLLHFALGGGPLSAAINPYYTEAGR